MLLRHMQIDYHTRRGERKATLLAQTDLPTDKKGQQPLQVLRATEGPPLLNRGFDWDGIFGNAKILGKIESMVSARNEGIYVYRL
ncbi:uncharacterized protein LAJ45_03539 [Morchella importuna]|uniref:uncharacterized protein n=1 Tax=Morchella importuna TaxID=1174673 RepID=UPI001E8EC705|nr:uncharacterized protein LAJ45_03539 [Morchella importuna]KAH8152697.1 hypothetical protein LAJ45_03539 [Morchella importuna]